jgi:hypothetical protein
MGNVMLSQSTESRESLDERKLWFDYVKTLNERRLASAQRSGLTAYGLLVLLAGLLYKFIPQIPPFIATPGLLRVGVITLALELVVLTWYVATFGMLFLYCAEEIENRATPESFARVEFIVEGIFMGAGLGLTISTIILLLGGVRLPLATRMLMVIFVLWLGGNIGFLISRKRARTVQAAKIGLPIPRFRYWPRVPGHGTLLFASMYFCLGLWSTFELTRYLRTSPVGWVQPLGAASIFCLVCVIVIHMFLRSLRTFADTHCLGLERDILLESLDTTEIKRRFLRYLAGTDIGQWFEDVLSDINEKNRTIQLICDEAKAKKNEIAQIDAERLSRCENLVNRITKAVEQRQSHFELLLSQAEFFVKCSVTRREKEIVDRMIKELRAQHESDTSISAMELCKEIVAVCKIKE